MKLTLDNLKSAAETIMGKGHKEPLTMVSPQLYKKALLALDLGWKPRGRFLCENELKMDLDDFESRHRIKLDP